MKMKPLKTGQIKFCAKKTTHKEKKYRRLSNFFGDVERRYQLEKFGNNEKIKIAYEKLKEEAKDTEKFKEIIVKLQPSKKFTERKLKYWFDEDKVTPIDGILFKLMQGVIPKPGVKMTEKQEKIWTGFCEITKCEVGTEELVEILSKVPQMTVEEKKTLMIKCQYEKYKEGYYKELLLSTVGQELIEIPLRGGGHPDSLWSQGKNGGKNLCGKCLMEVRDLIMQE